MPVNQAYLHPYSFLTFMEDTWRYKVLPDDSLPCHLPAGHRSVPFFMQRIGSPRPLAWGSQHPELHVQLPLQLLTTLTLRVMGNSSTRRSGPVTQETHSLKRRERLSMELICMRNERIIQPVEGRTLICKKTK